MIDPDAQGLYHPRTEQDVIDLVKHAAGNNLQVRVRGAAQSVPGAVFTSGGAPGKAGSGIDMELDQIRSVDFDDANMQATVGGGCNLGVDPFDPSHTSQKSDSNNLFYQLNKKGWGIHNVPDAIHQTVAGFISTGSSGGTMQHSFHDAIVSIRMVDGTGTARTFSRSADGNDPFFGAGVSMGLLGIITSVTLQCVPSFNIIGSQATTHVNDCEYDFFGAGSPGKPSLQQHLSTTEYFRALWWPFNSLQRVISWKAHTMQAGDYNKITGTPADFHPKPYQPVFPKVFGSTLPAEAVAGTGYSLIASWPDWFYELLGVSPAEATAKEKLLVKGIDTIAPYLYPLMIDLYFPLDNQTRPPQKFWDNWLGSLPMDRIEFSNNLMDLAYAEFWFPIENAQKVVDTLQSDYNKKGYEATGFYTTEVLSAKGNDFWLSPGYKQDSLRLNFMYFARGAGDPWKFYNQFWDLFRGDDFDMRMHWGKYLPPDTTASSYWQGRYPKWNDFLTLRKQMDPGGVFLTDYWKTQLGLS